MQEPYQRAYIRDTPLHQALVDDTRRAIRRNSRYRPRYFEGWYYKFDLPSGGTFVVIPGVYLRPVDEHAFIMVLDATTDQEPVCRMYTFPIDQVLNSVDGDHDFRFAIITGEHDTVAVFTAHSCSLQLPADGGNPKVSVQATWAAPLPLPVTSWWYPTIMGWFSYLPRGMMQCSHGVVSMDHAVSGGGTEQQYAQIGSDTTATRIDLTGARGYIEKDWGHEFPERYVWIQANDFEQQALDGSGSSPAVGASFLVSVASIPVKVFGRQLFSFTGFLSFLRYPDADTGTFRTLRFATYTLASASYTYNVDTATREHTVVVTLSSFTHRLTATVQGDRDGAATLWGPLPQNPSGGMQPYVREMLNCPVRVVLQRKRDGKILFHGTAQHGGFEIEGHEKEQRAFV